VAKYLLANGAKEVWVAATHGIFSGRAGELIKESGIKKFILPTRLNRTKSGLEILSIAPIIADYLRSKYLARK
jgi:ribose-phosphate pyrophosphokinase